MRKIAYTLFIAFSFLFIFESLAQSGTPYQDLSFEYPQFPLPSSAKAWEKGRKAVRQTIQSCFGPLPARPSIQAKTLRTEKRAGYTIEYFEFFNGIDATVPGILLIPDQRAPKAPGILYHHYHGGDYAHGKDELFKLNWVNDSGPGEGLVKQGYVVMAIDSYAFGERSGKGPNGPEEKGKNEELTWARINLLKGRSFWGSMVRDDQMALDYLCARPEVDPTRIGAVGMSMGCLRSYWLAAVDDRVKATVAVACIVRNQELIKLGRMGSHGIYYYVQDLLRHFDNEAVLACVAPRALLTMSGKADRMAPLEGVNYINGFLEKTYALYDKAGQFKHLEYDGVGHEYTREMWKETLAFFGEKL